MSDRPAGPGTRNDGRPHRHLPSFPYDRPRGHRGRSSCPASGRRPAGSGRRADARRSVGRRPRRDPRRTGPADDPPPVEVLAHDPCGGHQVRVAADRRSPSSRCRTARTPRSRRACDRGTCRTASRSPAPLEARRTRRPEATDPRPDERSVRVGRPARAGVADPRPDRRLAGQRMRPPPVASGGRGVARPEDVGRVESGGHRPGRLRRPAGHPGAPAGVPGRAPRAGPLRGELLVGAVDLGHPPGRGPGRRRVAAGEVGVVLPGQPSPGGLDPRWPTRRASARARHRGLVWSPTQSTGGRLTGRAGVSSPWVVPSIRRTGIVAGLTHRSARRRLPVRPRLPGAGRVPAPTPAAVHPGRPRPAVRGDGRRRPTAATCRPGSSRPGAAPRVPASSSSTAGTRPATGPCRRAPFLHAAGFHCLTFDVRGNGANPAESLPVSAGEYGADAAAGFAALLARPEVTRGAILGHSMGGVGAILAAAADPRVAAVVSVSAPSDPRRMVRQTFRLARLPVPRPGRHAARLADEPGLRPTARPRPPRDQRPARGRALRGTAPRRPRPGRLGHAGRARPPDRPGRPRRPPRLAGRPPRSSCSSSTRAATAGRTRTRPTAGRWPRSSPASSADRSAPEAAADAAAAADARRLPEPETPLVGDRAAAPALAMVGRSPAREP